MPAGGPGYQKFPMGIDYGAVLDEQLRDGYIFWNTFYFRLERCCRMVELRKYATRTHGLYIS